MPEDLPSEWSHATKMSLVSAPAKLSQHRCFFPRTRFQKQGCGYLSAAELKRNGGDVVMGPGGKAVTVCKAVRHRAEDRDCVCFSVEGDDQPFIITIDHPLKMEGPDQQPVVTEALMVFNLLCTWKRDGVNCGRAFPLSSSCALHTDTSVTQQPSF